jgi:hypothetical protein
VDTLSADTHTSEVTATVRDLERGLAFFPLSKAVNRIDDWKREILATENDALVPIADDLDALRGALTGEGMDGAIVGPILVRLADGTDAAAGGTPDPLAPALRRLASILRHAGSALAPADA